MREAAPSHRSSSSSSTYAAALPRSCCSCVTQPRSQRRSAWWLLWLLLLLHTAQGPVRMAAAAPDTGPAAAPTAATAAPATAASRFFIDEGYFLEGDTEILRAFIAASNGRMTISGESTAAFLSVKGYYVPDTWDVYWTIRQACQMAYKHMKPQQLVNCMPGISAMSLKRPFVSTWQQAYGELAFSYIPRSYLLPQQYWLWRSHLLAAGSPADRLWVLKANIHRGKGVSVMPQSEALSHALAHKHDSSILSSSGDSSSSGDEDGIHYLHILVQSYLQQQLVIAGRSSYIRVWLLVTSINPLRAYLFDGGFAIFGKQKGTQKGAQAASAAAGAAAGGDGKEAAAGGSSRSGSSSNGRRGSTGSSTDDLIVNLWTQDRNSSHIWSLQHLKQYLDQHPEAVQPSNNTQQQRQQQGQRQGQEQGVATGRHLLAGSSSSNGEQQPRQQQQQPRRRTFADAWKDMQTSAGLVLAAALPAMRAAAVEAGAPPQGMFEYFGIDFVLDAELRPWMLEVNAIPSMSRRKKSECSDQHTTAHCKLTTTTAAAGSGSGARAGPAAGNSSSSSGAAKAAAAEDEFDAQKEQFVHDMLVLLGLPVDAESAAGAGAKAAAGAGAGASAQRSTQDTASWLRMAAAAAAGIRSPVQPPAAATSKSKSSSGTPTSSSSTDRRRQLLSSQLPNSSSSNAINAEEWGYKGVIGLQWSGPAPDLQQLPQLQKLLCKTAATSTNTGSSTASSSGSSGSSSSGSGSGFACITCLTADDLAALSAAEAELQRAGRFVPVHDLVAAHRLNQEAFKQAPASAANLTGAASAAAGDLDSPTAAAAGGRDAPADNAAVPSAAAGVAATAPGALYLSQSRTVWQRLYRAWKGLSTGHVRGVRDLAVMKHYTAASTVHAQQQLQLQRQDYVMSAWLRVRQQEACQRLNAAECAARRLRLLTSTCYL